MTITHITRSGSLFWISLFWILLLSGPPLAAQDKSAPPATFPQAMKPDVRVIIDISGSMKQNDPNNLRRPALELLVQLFPEGSRAGVWTFGQWVNNLVKSQVVTDSWRVSARKQAQKINSVGLFTNIPAAINTALRDAPLEPGFQTHLILLTDGMVDVSRDPAENEAARREVLDEILPKLRDAGVRVHTVALSKNADSELMERLALETDGLAAVAESAEDLTRIFLQAFDAAAPAEEVPLEGNTFLVDSSIEEFTALVFKRDPSQQAVLVSPDTQKYTLADHGADVRWFSQQNYDLITVKQPYEGEWVIQADLEPNSRVTIVSNLSLQVNRLPKGHFIGNDVTLSAVLKEQGVVVDRAEFLKLVEVGYEITRRGDGQRWQNNLSAIDPNPADGVFTQHLKLIDQPGIYDVVVYAEGKTFQRQQTQTIEARRNFVVNTRSSDDLPAQHRVTVSTKNPQLDIGSLRLVATLTDSTGTPASYVLEAAGERRWQFEFSGAGRSTLYQVEIDISGQYLDGSPLRARQVVSIEHQVPGTTMVEPEPTPEPQPAPEPAPQPEPTPTPPPAPAPEPDAGISWGSIGLYTGLVIGNLLVLLLGYFAWKTLRGGSGSEVLAAADDFGEEEADPGLVGYPEADDEPDDEPEPVEPEPPEPEETPQVEAGELDDMLEDVVPVEEDEEAAPNPPAAEDVDILDLPDDAIDIDPDKP